VPYTRREVEDQYNNAAESPEEFDKVLWSSSEAMFNRFRLAMAELPFADAGSWLDVGCGTGAFQSLIRRTFPQVKATAVDISENLLEYARDRGDTAGVDFVLSDFTEFNTGSYDIITCIGVLQKTTFSAAAFFKHAAKLLVDGGTVHLDTKNLGWKAFAQPGFTPEPAHEWFAVGQLCAAATEAGLTVRKVQGFLPQEGAVVPLKESHTVFLIAQQEARSR